MPFLRYAKNVAKSTAYAAPAIIKNRIPSVHALVSQFTDEGQREGTLGAIREMQGIIKEDVFGLMKKGLDSAQKELKTGKLYQTEEEEMSAFGEAMGFDDSLLGNDFLNDTGSSDESGGSSAATTASVAASAAAAGAASGVAAAASRLGDSPAQRATAEAGFATARFARANLGASIAVGNAIRGAVLANAQILGEIHKFQVNVQQDYYRKQIEHNAAMAAMTSEMLNRLSELKNVSTVAAAASDQIMQAFSGRETDFGKVFGEGDFNVNAYLGVMSKRLQSAVSDGSMFKTMGTQLASGPLTFAFQKALESVIPKNFGRQLEQFNEFVGNLGSMLNERMRNMARRKGGMTGKLLDFFSIAPESMAEGPDLSKIVRGKAVAFDGYAHRSIVEIIPSYLSDIHAELVAMRRHNGIQDPSDRKLYDFKTGRMTSEKLMKAQFEKGIDRRAMSGFDGTRKIIGDGGNKQTALEIQAALRTLGKEQFSINAGSADDLAAQIDGEIIRLAKAGKTKEAAALRSGKHHIVRARTKYGTKFSAKLQSDILSYNREHVKAMASLSNEEGAARMMFSGDIYDAEKRRSVAGGLDIARRQAQTRGRGGKKGKATADVAGGSMALDDEIMTVGEGQGFEGAKSGSIFRDANGKVTFKSLIAAPMNAVSKAMDAFHTRVSEIFFGDGKKKGIFASIKDSLMGDVDPKTGKRTGPLGKVVDYVKFNVFNPLKKAMVGDPSDPESQKKSIVGVTKRWFKEAVDHGKTFLFGKMVEGADGQMKRQGGLFGGLVNWFSGKSKQLKEMLFGKSADGKSTGLLSGLKEKFDGMVKRVQVALFGTVGEDGRRSGGAFGDAMQKGKDFLKGLWDKFQENAVKPMSVALFGTVVDGRRQGGAFGNALQKGKDFVTKLWGDTKQHVLGPLREALFGKGTLDEKGVLKGQGIFPKLWDTVKQSVIEPMAESLLGKKTGPNGERQGGALKVMWQSMKDAMAPLKETFVGKDGIWTNMKKGLADTFADLKKSLFGGDDGDKRPFMERMGEKISLQIKRFGDWMTEKLKPVTEWIQKGGDWLKTKVFEPFNSWLNDPKTGFITRMREGAATFFYGKQNEDGVREGGLFGSIKKGMDRFFYGDPNDPNRKGFVERVVEPAKKFVLEEIWQPLKKNMSEMWEETKDFLKKEVWAPLQGVMQPFFTEAKEQWKNLKEWGTNVARGIGESINATFKNAFGTSLTEMLKKNVLDPIKDALGSVKQFLMTSLKAVLKFPVNVIRGASDELAASQIRRGIFKGSAEERERIMARNKIDPSTVPHGAGSSIGASQPAVKAGGSVTESGGSAEKKGGLFSWFSRKGKNATAVEEAAMAGAAAATMITTGSKSIADVATAGGSSSKSSASADGTKAGNSSAPSVSQAQPDQQTRAQQAQADAASNGSSVKGSGRYDPIRIAQATADNTSNIYQFLTKHLWGVGKNVERIVKHFKIKDGALGGNTDEKRPSGLLGKLKRMITNPIGFFSDMVTGVFDFMKKQVGRVFELAKNVIMLPIKGIVKGFELLNTVVGKLRGMFGNILGAAKDLIVGTLGAAFQVAGTIIREGTKALGTALTTIAKAIPDVVGALSSAAVGILKAGSQLALGAVQILGSMTATIAEVGAKMLVTAVKVTKDVVTGLARITFDAIGSAFNMITGRGKGGRLGKLTPVYVTGGYLAGTAGGASTLAEAQAAYGGGRLVRTAVGAVAGLATGTGPLGALIGAGMGFFSGDVAQKIAEGKVSITTAMKRNKERMTGAFKDAGRKFEEAKASAAGGFSALKERARKAKAAIAETDWKEKMLQAGDETRKHLDTMKKGFGKIGDMLMLIGPALLGLVKFFTEGKFLTMLGNVLGKGGMLGKAGEFVGKHAGKLKGVGIGAVAGIGGSMLKDWADSNMEDGLGKSAVKTGGAMLEYGGMGAMIGSVVPGVGTAVGGAVGAGVGAIVENWDSIKSGLGKAGDFLKGIPDRLGKMFDGAVEMVQDGFKSAKDLVSQIPSMLGDAFSKAGDFVMDGLKAVGDGLKDYFLSGGLIGKLLGWTPEKTEELADSAMKVMGSVVDSIKELPGKIFGAVKDFLLGAVEGVKSGIKDAGSWLSNKFSSWFGGDEKEAPTPVAAAPAAASVAAPVAAPVAAKRPRQAAAPRPPRPNRVSLGEAPAVIPEAANDPLPPEPVRPAKTSLGEAPIAQRPPVVAPAGGGTVRESDGTITKKSDIEAAKQAVWGGELPGGRRNSPASPTPGAAAPSGQPINPESKEGREEILKRMQASQAAQGEELKRLQRENPGKVVRKNPFTGKWEVAPGQNRAFGGPLGSDHTLVGELGPEVLDSNGNVISGARKGGKFQDPKLVEAAQNREDSLLSVLKSIRDNTFFAASYGEATTLGTLVGSADEAESVRNSLRGLKSLNSDKAFKPGNAVNASKIGLDGKLPEPEEGESDSLFGDSFGSKFSESGTGTGIMDKLGQMGGVIGDTASKVGSTVMSTGKSFLSNISSGNFSGAMGALKSGASQIGTTLSGGASDIGSIAKGKPTADVLQAIKEGSATTGANFGYMMAMAGQESGFNPAAKASSSSASGLYQFIDSTWDEMVNRYGKTYGITKEDRGNPRAQAVMAGLYARENAAAVKRILGRDANPTELYLGHFMGAGGVTKFLSAMQQNPNAVPAEMKEFEKAAEANPTIFYTDKSKKTPRTFQQIYDLMYQKVGAKAEAYAKEYSTADITAGAPGGGAANDKNMVSDPGTLKVKSGESTAGGAIHRGLDSIAHLIQGSVDGFKYFPALNDGFHQKLNKFSHHKEGRALDFTVTDKAKAASAVEKTRGILSSMGMQPGEYELIDEYANPSGHATGGHIHFAFRSDAAAERFFAQASQNGNTQVAKAGDSKQPIKTAMLGGFLSKHMPTLVGEREPEVLGPDGRIHRSVESYLASPSADVSGLMTSTAVKEAMKRASNGPDSAGAGEAISKIMAAGGMGGNSETLLAQMLQVLQQIAGNTAPIAGLASAGGEGNKTVNIDASDRQGGNVFAISQPAPRKGPGMSPAMQRVVAGG
jgi:hypothetical protein